MDQQNPPSLSAPTVPITLLGQREPRIPTAGKIRAGIKVLTKKAASNPRVKALYDDGVVSNATFDEIERKIIEAFPGIENPLVPKNVAWFTVRPNDFPNPALADQILALYGEDRGDGIRRLYRFPVMFPADRWQAVMPHELACWSRNEKRYWSEYGSDGHTRFCKMHAPARIDERTRRVVRTFGGRGTQLRPENDGRCDPENCPEFQGRHCNLTGRFIFYIPGIKSLDAFELHTNSFYALSRAIERFETIAFLRGGRLAGFLDRRHTPFFLTKKLREVSHLDPKTGQPVRSAHWIIELEAPIDVSALLIEQDRDAAIQLAEDAVRTLQGEASRDLQVPALQVAPSATETFAPCAPTLDAPQAPTATGEGAPASTPAAGTEAIYALAATLGVSPERLDAYADWHWGVGWRRNAQGSARVLAELEDFRSDPQGLIDKIAAEIGE
ncbi:hypothetical protein GM658_05805 [Pseudoduganella eburnea]|uniref:Uncharacterized protein n=1 Tax=Massilia eburnea TaxID=1776165 RepID=A0A6L6QDD8_9BURK|nr:hypothetical protein [Massilia eburnea]MTW10111.1 hypothetical protein [Massilia eburnea]